MKRTILTILYLMIYSWKAKKTESTELPFLNLGVGAILTILVVYFLWLRLLI